MKFLFLFLSVLLIFTENVFLLVLIFILMLLSLLPFSKQLWSSHWYLYLLLMVYVGGLMILFLYVASLLKKDWKSTWSIFFYIIFLFFIFLPLPKKFYSMGEDSGLFALLTKESWFPFSWTLLSLLVILCFASEQLFKESKPLRAL